MIHEIKGDLLEEFRKGTVNIIGHQANCHCVMGSGIAKQIREQFPEAFYADKDTETYYPSPESKLGESSYEEVDAGVIFNLYGQFNYLPRVRQTNYEALYKSLDGMFRFIDREFKKGRWNNKTPPTFGFPKLMGCGLAGGDWRIVRPMIDVIFEGSGYDVYIVEWDKK